MVVPRSFLTATPLLFLWLMFFSVNAEAAIDNVGIFDNVLARYKAVANGWATIVTSYATWLFWTLALISMVWTFGMMALRKADMSDFFAEFVRFTIFTGFFWWLLQNGPYFATSIMDSLRQIGAVATGKAATFTPSGIVDIGFAIFSTVLNQSSPLSPINSAVGILISVIILIIMALIGVNMLLLLISGWILAFAGVFFLGFGGSRWTSEMAINYFRTVLNIAVQLFTMVLLIGIGKSFVDDYYAAMSATIGLDELAVMLIVAVVLLSLVNKVPPLVGGLSGAPTGAIGSGFAAGAALGVAAGATAVAGAALAAGGANLAGGTHALVTAFSAANASESASSGAHALMAAAGGGGSRDIGSGSSGEGSALAVAMGNSGGGRIQTSDVSGSSIGSHRDIGGAGGGVDSANTFASAGSGNDGAAQPDGASAGTDAKEEGDAGRATGKVPSGGVLATTAKVGRVVAGTAVNLARGSLDVAKAKANDMRKEALTRIGETPGGKVAAAIKARGAGGAAHQSNAGTTANFDNDSLSAGNDNAVDTPSEVAAFRDGKPKNT